MGGTASKMFRGMSVEVVGGMEKSSILKNNLKHNIENICFLRKTVHLSLSVPASFCCQVKTQNDY